MPLRGLSRRSILPSFVLAVAALDGPAAASVCAAPGLAVPHEGVVLPPGFRVVWDGGLSRCDGVEIRDADGGVVDLLDRDGACTAPDDLPSGTYAFAALLDEGLVSEGSFTVVEDASSGPPSLRVGELVASRVQERSDGCGDQPAVGDVVVRVDVDAAPAMLGGWWLSLDVSTAAGEPLGTDSALVSPPDSPGEGRGVGVTLTSPPAGPLCGALRWTGPDGASLPAGDLDDCRRPGAACDSAGGASPVSAAGLVVVLGALRVRRRTSSPRSS